MVEASPNPGPNQSLSSLSDVKPGLFTSNRCVLCQHIKKKQASSGGVKWGKRGIMLKYIQDFLMGHRRKSRARVRHFHGKR